MEFVVEKIFHSVGQFTDPKTGKLISYDNKYLLLVSYGKDGRLVKPILPKIKSENIPQGLCVGDYVKVYYNEYKQPEAVYISRKGDNQ